jgi:hypothetical protein
VQVDLGEQLAVGGVCWALHQLGGFVDVIAVEIARRGVRGVDGGFEILWEWLAGGGTWSFLEGRACATDWSMRGKMIGTLDKYRSFSARCTSYQRGISTATMHYTRVLFIFPDPCMLRPAVITQRQGCVQATSITSVSAWRSFNSLSFLENMVFVPG